MIESTFGPNFLQRYIKIKNLDDLAMTDAIKKISKLTCENPLAIVTILYGIGVKPLRAMMKKAYSLNPEQNFLKDSP